MLRIEWRMVNLFPPCYNYDHSKNFLMENRREAVMIMQVHYSGQHPPFAMIWSSFWPSTPRVTCWPSVTLMSC